MFVSAAGMSICQICLTGLGSQPDNDACSKASVFFFYMYYFVYTLGFLGIPFLYASEIAPVHLRAAVCGISTAVSWLFNYLVVEVTPIAFATISYRYFIVFAAINASAIPVVYFFYPESMYFASNLCIGNTVSDERAYFANFRSASGRSLEEIDEIFTTSKSIFDPVKVAKRLPRKQLTDHLVEDGKVESDATRIENAGSFDSKDNEKAE